MAAAVRIEGIDQMRHVAAALRTSGRSVGAKGATVLRSYTFLGQRISMQKAPVDTGFLRGSISVEFRGDGRNGTMEGIWGPAADYGAYVEFGTSRQAPQPYIGPAADQIAPDYLAAMAAITDPLA